MTIFRAILHQRQGIILLYFQSLSSLLAKVFLETLEEHLLKTARFWATTSVVCGCGKTEDNNFLTALRHQGAVFKT